MTFVFILTHLAIFGLLAATAFAAGRWVTRGLSFPSPVAELAVATATGLGCLGSAGLALGLVGWLEAGAVVALILGIHLLALPIWRGLFRRWREASVERRKWALAAALLGLALLFPILLLAIYPPNSFDDTMYHLPFARFFAEEGRVAFAPHLRYPVFPQQVDLVFTLMFLVATDVSAAMVQTLALALVALLLYAWCETAWRESNWRETASGQPTQDRQAGAHRCGVWAAAIWLGNPLVVWNGRAAMVDVALALYVVLAAYAFSRWKASDQPGWLALAAAGCGFAAATKYHGLLAVAAFGVAMAFDAVKRKRLKPAALAAAVLLLVAGPWYGRMVYHTGNPVFPFLSQVFGESEWSFFLQHEGLTEAAPGAPEPKPQSQRLLTAVYEVPELLINRIVKLVSENAPGLLAMPWQLSFGKDYFGSAPVSPAYLLGMPFLLALAVRSSLARVILAVSGMYLLVWLASAQDPRYLTPVLGLLAVPMALATARLAEALPASWKGPLAQRMITLWGGALLISSGFTFTHAKLAHQGPLPITAEQRDAYLARNPRYAAVSHLNQTYGSDYTVYAIASENLVYYAEGRLLGDHFGPARYSKLSRWMADPPGLHAVLREFDADFFLVPGCQKVFRPAAGTEPLFELVYRRSNVCVYRLGSEASEDLLESSDALASG
ncbi:MAG: phospholipid carrier-dependent glycosyltransferase [Acidobacteriota bacterium]